MVQVVKRQKGKADVKYVLDLRKKPQPVSANGPVFLRGKTIHPASLPMPSHGSFSRRYRRPGNY